MKYHVIIPIGKGIGAMGWCEENFGQRGVNWDWIIPYFYFRHKKDYAWFVLRWS
jgi:hypothetical protein